MVGGLLVMLVMVVGIKSHLHHLAAKPTARHILSIADGGDGGGRSIPVVLVLDDDADGSSERGN